MSPDFPRYQSKRELTTQQPSVTAPKDNTASLIQQAGEVGEAIQASTLKVLDSYDTIQKTTSLANFKSGILDIENRAANDPNYNNSKEYYKEIQKLKEANLKDFSSKSAENEMALTLNYEAQVSSIKIENIYKKKAIDVGQTSALKLLDLEAAKPGPDLEKRLAGILEPQVQAGIFDRKDAYKLQKDYLKKGKFNGFLGDLQNNPNEVDANLSKNTYDFDVKELRDAQSIHDTEAKKIQANNQTGVINAYLNGEEVSPDYLKSEMNKGKLTPEFTESMINKINNPKPDRPSQDKAYIEFQNLVTDIQDKGDEADIQDIIKLMTNTMKAHAEGLLDEGDVKRILKDRNELIQEKLEKQAEDILKKTNPKTILQHLTFWSDEYAKDRPEIKARMYRKLIDGVMAGQDANALVTKVIQDEMDIKLGEVRANTDRQYALDPETKERVAYSEDGGNTWIDIKTGQVRK